MLEAMRKGSKNIFVKIFLGVLALSFIVWGVGDVFRGRTSNAIASVGDIDVSYSEYRNLLQREIARYQQILGSSLSDEQIDQFNIRQIVLNQIIDGKLIRKRIGDLKIKVGNTAAKEQILSNNLFFNEAGQFDKDNFNAILESNGLNKDDYVAALKQDMAVKMFLDTIAAEPADLKLQAKSFYKYQNEKRVADFLVVPAGYVKEVQEPSETDLVQYYQENSQKFAVPQMREATYITFGIDSIYNDLNISDEVLRAEYEANIDMYNEPEKRDVDQYLFASESEANAASQDLKKGKFNSYSDKKISLTKVTKEGLPDDVKGVIFNLKPNDISKPIQTSLGWHLFVVNNIIPPHIKPFKDVKDSIEKQLKESGASEMLFEFANQVEDEFASGLTIEQVAGKFDVVIHKTPAIDKQGKGNSGKVITNIPEKETFIPLVFNTNSGEESSLVLLSDNETYVVVRVDSITPERVKALDEVKGIAIGFWKKEQKAKKLKELASNFAKQLKQGKTINKLASQMKLKINASKKISRPTQDTFLDSQSGEPVSLVKELFELQEGEFTNAYKTSDNDFMIAQLKEIKQADIEKNKLGQLHKTMKEDFTDDILNQYNTFLRKKYPISVNMSLLKGN